MAQRFVERLIEYLRGLGLIAAGVMVAVLCGEVMVRYMAPQNMYRFPKGLFVNEAGRRYKLAANFTGESKTAEYRATIATNSLGLREDREYPEKANGTYRVISLGDSFAMGVGVELEDSLAKVLERLCQSEDKGLKCEVINAGVPGYNTRQEVAYLRDEGLKLKPNYVLLQFYVGNDITDNFYQPAQIVVDGYLRDEPPPPGVLPYKIRDILAIKSQLYHFLWPLVDRTFDPSRRERDRRRLERFLSVYEVSDNQGTQAMWNTTWHLLMELKRLTGAHSVGLGVAVIPDPIQVSGHKWARAIEAIGRDAGKYELENPNRRIVELCNSLGIAVLDLLPTFIKDNGSEPTYFNLDGHWTKRGNLLAAQAVEVFLEDVKVRNVPNPKNPAVEPVSTR